MQPRLSNLAHAGALALSSAPVQPQTMKGGNSKVNLLSPGVKSKKSLNIEKVGKSAGKATFMPNHKGSTLNLPDINARDLNRSF